MNEAAYLEALRSYGIDWEERFPNFYRTRYWGLFLNLYERKENSITIKEAINFLTTGDEELDQKTLRNYLELAREAGLVSIKPIKGKRAHQVSASPRLIDELEEHLKETAAHFARAFTA